jgi:restriction system protein
MGKAKQDAKVWVIRAGGQGEDEEVALALGLAIISFREAGDLSKHSTIDEVAKDILPGADGNENRAANWARQLWAFSRTAEIGDIVVLPLKSRPGQIALGHVSGPYEYRRVEGEFRHTRSVNWIKKDLARSTFKQDLLYSFGAFLTVCRIARNNAEARVAAVLDGKPDPGFSGDVLTSDGTTVTLDSAEAAGDTDLAQQASDRIVAAIRDRFTSHELARLVGAILEADGYAATISAPGPDGGADILAGRGPLGLDRPTLCVQVKATAAAADVKIVRELVGTMETFKAEQGLLVCWGGFTQAAIKEARQHAFRLRLWDESHLVNALYRAYPKLSRDIQAELPLKQIWILVQEGASDS